jgi:hypothetical protein
MQFDMAQLAPRDRYKLLVSTVVPAPDCAGNFAQ